MLCRTDLVIWERPTPVIKVQIVVEAQLLIHEGSQLQDQEAVSLLMKQGTASQA